MTKLYINYAQITNYAARSIYATVEPKYFAAVEAYLVDRNINQEIYDISCEDFLFSSAYIQFPSSRSTSAVSPS